MTTFQEKIYGICSLFVCTGMENISYFLQFEAVLFYGSVQKYLLICSSTVRKLICTLKIKDPVI